VNVKKFLYVVGGVLFTVAFLLIEFRQWRLSMYREMTMEQVADVETGELIFLFLGIGLVLVLVFILVGFMRGNTISLPTPRYDGGINRVPQRPRPQIREPLRINVPRLISGNQAQPLDLVTDDEEDIETTDWVNHERYAVPSSPDRILSTTYAADGATLPVQVDVSLNRLYQFAKLDGPSREGKWRGKSTRYTDALKFFKAQGFLTPEGKWKAEYPKDVRLKWLEQFEE
jgi:hypothetical protein